LKFADRDAEELAQVLQGQRGLFSQVRCRTLVNGRATREAILTALSELVKDVKEERGRGNLSLAVVALSGHGEKDTEVGDRFFYLPHDFDPDKPALDATGLSGDTLRAFLREAPCPVVLVLDCCHSGAMRVQGERGLRRSDTPDDAGEALRGLRQSARGVLLLAACADNQTAREDAAWGHGALTLALLQSLQRPAAASSGSPILYLDEVVRRTEETFKELLRKRGLRKVQSLVREQAGIQALDTIPIGSFPERK
jgi:uncharacterized caspase-like protein